MLQWIGVVARLVVGGVLLVAGVLKVSDPIAGKVAVRAFEIVPEPLVGAVAYGQPALEIAVGLCLLLGLLTRPAAGVAAVLVAAFALAIVSVWVRGIEIDCGCFGGGGAEEGASSAYPWDLARNTGLLLGSLWLVVRPRTPLSVDAALRGPERYEDVEEEAEH